MSIRVDDSAITAGGWSDAAGGAMPVSPLNGARLYYATDLGELRVSQNGGPYAPLGVGVNPGWTDTGPVVTLTNPADQVSASADGAAPAAGIKVRAESTPAATTGSTLQVLASGTTLASASLQVDRLRVAPLAPGEQYWLRSSLRGNAADPPGTANVWARVDTLKGGGALSHIGLGFYNVGGAVADNIDYAVIGLGTKITIASDFPGGAGQTVPVRLEPSFAYFAGDPGSDVELAPGEGLGGGAPGVVAIERGALAFGGLPAGSPGPNVRMRCNSSAGLTFVQLQARAEAAAARQRLAISDPAGDVMTFERDAVATVIRQAFPATFGPWRLETAAGAVGYRFDGTRVGVLGALGTAAVASLGQLTDNTTGAAGNTLDATADGTTNDNFRRLLDRVNQLEAIIKAFGLLS